MGLFYFRPLLALVSLSAFNNFFMLRVVRMSCHFFNSTFVCTTKHYHTHAISGSLANDCGVCIVVKGILELLIDLFILCCHGN